MTVKRVNTETFIEIENGEVKAANIAVDESLPDIISSRISEDNGKMGSLVQIEGQVLMKVKNFGLRTNVFLNRSGDLIIDAPDAENYSLVEGNLMYDATS